MFAIHYISSSALVIVGTTVNHFNDKINEGLEINFVLK